MSNETQVMAEPGTRHFLVGTTRAGKSAHLYFEMLWRSETYPDIMQALADTKPRFRAETERMPFNPRGRRNAAWRYRAWRKGPVLPNSVLVPLWDDHPFRGLWQRPGEIAVFQSDNLQDRLRTLRLLMAFVKAHTKDRDRHLNVDELLDWYGRTTHSISAKDDVFYLAARAGGERGVGETLAAQRVRGVPILIRDMISLLTLYQIDQESDLGYLAANGIKNARPPKTIYAFNQWRKQPGGLFTGPFTGMLGLPDSYLSQLSAT